MMDMEDEYITLLFDGEVNSYVIRYVELERAIDHLLNNDILYGSDFKDSLITNLKEEKDYIGKQLKNVYDMLPDKSE